MPPTAPEPVVAQPHIPVQADAPDTIERPFPHIIINFTARTIEVDAYVPLEIHTGIGGEHYLLEQFVCTPQTKPHESLLVTRARAAHIHASLLLLGLEPGSPVTFDREDPEIAYPATGPEVRVRFRYEEEGVTRVVHPAAWTCQEDSGDTMPELDWLFSGSTMQGPEGNQFYEADSAGTVIGLASFGGETLSWPAYIRDLEETGDLQWFARNDAMPPADTPVTIVITPAE